MRRVGESVSRQETRDRGLNWVFVFLDYTVKRTSDFEKCSHKPVRVTNVKFGVEEIVRYFTDRGQPLRSGSLYPLPL